MGAKKIKLKPCPFCGKDGAQEITTLKDCEKCGNFEDEICPAYKPWSDEDDCPGFFVVCSVLKGGCGAASGWHSTPEKAERAWNRRT